MSPVSKPESSRLKIGKQKSTSKKHKQFAELLFGVLFLSIGLFGVYLYSNKIIVLKKENVHLAKLDISDYKPTDFISQKHEETDSTSVLSSEIQNLIQKNPILLSTNDIRLFFHINDELIKEKIRLILKNEIPIYENGNYLIEIEVFDTDSLSSKAEQKIIFQISLIDKNNKNKIEELGITIDKDSI